MFAPEAIYVGYGTVQQMMTVEGALQFSPWLLLLLPLLRIVTTSLSVGSGGSGGIFGPGMVIGGVFGGFAWRFGHDLPGFPQEPGPVVIICMIAAFGSIAHVPLAMLLMVGEMTGNLSLLAPAMVAVAIATLVVGETSIYESQVPTRADSPAHKHRFAFPLLSSLPLSRALRPAPVVPADTPAAKAADFIHDARIVLVVTDDNEIAGATAERILAAARSGEGVTVGELAQPAPEALHAGMPFDEALDRLTASGVSWLPVVDDVSQRPLGVIDGRALVRSYREAAASTSRHASARLTTFEVLVGEGSHAASCCLSQLRFPSGARVVNIVRGDDVLVPTGETLLQPGDFLTVAVTSHADQRAVEALLGA
jgi:CIC family chloride channel protein